MTTRPNGDVDVSHSDTGLFAVDDTGTLITAYVQHGIDIDIGTNDAPVVNIPIADQSSPRRAAMPARTVVMRVSKLSSGVTAASASSARRWGRSPGSCACRCAP